jgi:hypothetical protein
VARLVVVQRGELLDCSPADLVDHALAEAPVQVAHQLGIGLGQLSERAVQEVDPRGALVLAVGGLGGRLEAEPAELPLLRRPASTPQA